MRTTLDIPAELMEEARRLLGFKSKTDVVVVSLKELIRRHRIEELKDLLGSVRLEIDVPRSRRRPRDGSGSDDRSRTGRRSKGRSRRDS